MQDCEKEANLTSKTKIGLTFGELIAVITIAGAFAMGYANLSARIAAIEQNKVDKEAYYEIKSSLIRIEGKLDLKQDKFSKQ